MVFILETSNKAEQQQVLSTLTTILKRVKANHNIQLPLSEIQKFFVDNASRTTSSKLIANFCLLFYDVGATHLPYSTTPFSSCFTLLLQTALLMLEKASDETEEMSITKSFLRGMREKETEIQIAEGNSLTNTSKNISSSLNKNNKSSADKINQSTVQKQEKKEFPSFDQLTRESPALFQSFWQEKQKSNTDNGDINIRNSQQTQITQGNAQNLYQYPYSEFFIRLLHCIEIISASSVARFHITNERMILIL